MKCCVVKNAKGEVVAAYPLEAGGLEIELELEKGEQAAEMDISEKDMCDPDSFIRACSGKS